MIPLHKIAVTEKIISSGFPAIIADMYPGGAGASSTRRTTSPAAAQAFFPCLLSSGFQALNL